MNENKLTAVLALLISTHIGLADHPLDNWTWRNPIPPPLSLYAVTYGNGQFVAVGENGIVLTSPDGMNWVARLSGIADALTAVAYGNGQFVTGYNTCNADGCTGTILGSADGVSWNRRAESLEELSAVAYGNGLFVACATDAVYTSADGANWNRREFATSGLLRSITYGNGQFVGLGWDNTATSSDGVKWSLLPSGGAVIAYGGGQFVKVLDGGAIQSSTDAVNWITRRGGMNSGLINVAYGGGQFVAVGFTGLIVTSNAGANWVERQSGTLDNLFSATFGNGQFVAVGDQGAIVTSTDGVSWFQAGSPRNTSFFSAIAYAYGQGQFVGIGDFGTIQTSADLTNWIPRQSGTQYGLKTVAYGNGRFVVGGDDNGGSGTIDEGAPGSILLTSTDGVTWEQHSPQGIQFFEIVYGNDQFVTRGYDSQSGMFVSGTSRDGIHWNKHIVPQVGLSGIACGAGLYVMVGGAIYGNGNENATILTSTDGAIWLEQQAPTTNKIYGVTYGNGQFVAVSGHVSDIFAPPFLNQGSILSSEDGVNWVLRVPDVTPGLRKVAYGGGQFVAAGDNGVLLTSADGVNWVHRQSVGGWRLGPSGVTFADSHFEIVGPNQTILESGSIISLMITRGTGPLRLALEGPTGLEYTIQTSIDLISWRNLTNVTTAQPISAILAALPATSDHLFYRAYSQ